MSTSVTGVPVEGMPAELVDKGWQLLKSETTPPRFRARNGEAFPQKVEFGPYPTSDEAVTAARDLDAEAKKAADTGMKLVFNPDGSTEFEDVEARSAAKKASAKKPAQPAADPVETREPEVEQLAMPSSITHPPEPGEHLLAVEVIRIDGGTQLRALFDEEVVSEYAEAMLAGAKFPPVDVFFDGANYWLGNGFYRTAATKKAKLRTILAAIRFGTRRDAVLFSAGANADHGQPRTNADKRAAATMLLMDSEWTKWSDGEIARQANVSQPFVSALRRELTTQNVLSEQTTRVGKDSVARDTSKIGRKTDEEKEAIAREESEAEPPLFTEPTDESEGLSSHEGLTNEDGTVENFEEDSEETLAQQAARREVAGGWSTADVVDAIKKNGGTMYRGQLEEAGCTYAAILGALHEEAIEQPEVGKYGLPASEPEASKTGESSETAAAKSEESTPASSTKLKAFHETVDALLKGRMLTVSFTWIPGVKGKVQHTVNASNDPQKASRKLLDAEKVRPFSEDVLQMITEQLKGAPAKAAPAPAKPATRPSASKASKKKAPKPSRPKAPTKKKVATKKAAPKRKASTKKKR